MKRRMRKPSGEGDSLRLTRRGGRILILAGFVLFVVLAWMVLGPADVLDLALEGEDSGTEAESGSIEVIVPEGMTADQVASLLEEKGVIRSDRVFRLRVKIEGAGAEIKPGVYSFAPGESAASVLGKLTEGPGQKTEKVLIPEGLSIEQTGDRLSSDGVVDGEDYVDQARDLSRFDPPSLAGTIPDVQDLEGFLFPSTYTIAADSGAGELIQAQLDAFTRKTAALPWERAESLGLEPLDVLTVASIIEKEVRIPEERAKVAAVIYNRLEKDMPLGADATVRFALKKWTGPLTKSDLAVDSPYNTRKYEGMPPGPVASPGLAAIRAALEPAEADYLYYVLVDEEGHHFFTESYQEFLDAKEKGIEQ